jgi:hypothetical protein
VNINGHIALGTAARSTAARHAQAAAIGTPDPAALFLLMSIWIVPLIPLFLFISFVRYELCILQCTRRNHANQTSVPISVRIIRPLRLSAALHSNLAASLEVSPRLGTTPVGLADILLGVTVVRAGFALLGIVFLETR